MTQSAAVRTSATPFGTPTVRIEQPVHIPQEFHLGHALGHCPECSCPEKILRSRALLALMPPDEAEQLAHHYGLQTDGDDPMPRNVALAILNIGERAVPRVLTRLRTCLEEAATQAGRNTQLVSDREAVPV